MSVSFHNITDVTINFHTTFSLIPGKSCICTLLFSVSLFEHICCFVSCYRRKIKQEVHLAAGLQSDQTVIVFNRNSFHSYATRGNKISSPYQLEG